MSVVGLRLGDPLSRHRDALGAGLLGALVALAVVLPWVDGNPLFLLDWVIGPQTPVLPRPAFGLDGGVTANLPRFIAAASLERLLGTTATWLPVAMAFPLAAVSFARLAAYAGTSRAGQLAGALLYCVNPWVLDRVAVGHVGLLLGYALLPAFVLVVMRDAGSSGRSAVKSGLLLALLMGLSLHLVWIALPVMGLRWLLGLRSWRGLGWNVLALGCAGLCSSYLLIGAVASGRTHALPGTADLSAYQTAGGSLPGVVGNVLSLQGFWRLLPGEPARLVPAWPLICVALLVVVSAGYAGTAGRGRRAKATGQVVALSGLVGLALALGARGPLGDAFRALYDHLPGFKLMREPQKFVMLLALAYALGFGWGAERLLSGLSRWRRGGGALVLGLLLLSFSPGLFWGVGGSVATSQLPASWAVADRAMGESRRSALVLPWHLYMSYPFTEGRVIASPVPAVFAHPVVTGDVAELPGVPEQDTTARSEAVMRLLERGPTTDITADLQALRVEFVVLLKGGDWPSYSWLEGEPGLTRLLTTRDLDLWRVTEQTASDCDVRHTRSDQYRANCTGTELILEEPYDAGWRVNGLSGTETSAGLTQFRVEPGEVTVSYEGSGKARALLWLSLGVFAFLSMSLAVATRSLAVWRVQDL